MKILLDIKDSKAAFFIELLKNFSFVRTTPISDAKAELLQDIKHAVEEVKHAKERNIKLQSAKSLLDEL